MYDSFNRDVTYLRVSITDRCNLRCTYCMPAEGIKLLSHFDVLSYEEIIEIVRYGVLKGINKVRITGGEPLVRKGVTGLVNKLARIEGVTDLSLTTNGILLEKYAKDLALAGLKRINVSLDTIDEVKYSKITRGGDLKQVIRGIDAAVRAGLKPVKINCVIRNNVNEVDALSVKKFAEKLGLEVRFIHLMGLHTGNFSKVIGGEGGCCEKCNRLRLTADGKLKPCLFNDIEFDVRELGVPIAYDKAVKNKPKYGEINTTGTFYNIGG